MAKTVKVILDIITLKYCRDFSNYVYISFIKIKSFYKKSAFLFLMKLMVRATTYVRKIK